MHTKHPKFLAGKLYLRNKPKFNFYIYSKKFNLFTYAWILEIIVIIIKKRRLIKYIKYLKNQYLALLWFIVFYLIYKSIFFSGLKKSINLTFFSHVSLSIFIISLFTSSLKSNVLLNAFIQIKFYLNVIIIRNQF